MQWLWSSLIASVVLTVIANVVVRRWPDATARGFERLAARLDPPTGAGSAGGPRRSRVRILIPWKAMLVASLALTVLFNLLLRAG